jgi:hypothetical protein
VESFEPDVDRRVSRRVQWMSTVAVLLIGLGCCGAWIWFFKIIDGIVADTLRMP